LCRGEAKTILTLNTPHHPPHLRPTGMRRTWEATHRDGAGAVAGSTTLSRVHASVPSTDGTCGDAIVAASPLTAGLAVARGAAPWPSNPSARNARGTLGMRTRAADGVSPQFVPAWAGLVRRSSLPFGPVAFRPLAPGKPPGTCSSSRVRDTGGAGNWLPDPPACTASAKDFLSTLEGLDPVGRAHECGGPCGRLLVADLFGAARVQGHAPQPHNVTCASTRALAARPEARVLIRGRAA
jgi:hypothetical protein